MPNTNGHGNGVNNFLKRIGSAIAIIIVVFSAGTGWGLYAATISATAVTSVAQQVSIDTLNERVVDVEKYNIRFDEKMNNIIEKLDRIEKKLDD